MQLLLSGPLETDWLNWRGDIHQGEAALRMLKFNLLVTSLQRRDYRREGNDHMCEWQDNDEAVKMVKECRGDVASLLPEERGDKRLLCKMQRVKLTEEVENDMHVE